MPGAIVLKVLAVVFWGLAVAFFMGRLGAAMYAVTPSASTQELTVLGDLLVDVVLTLLGGFGAMLYGIGELVQVVATTGAKAGKPRRP